MVTGFVVEGVDHDPQASARARQALRRIEGSLTECVQAAQRHGDLDPEADAPEISQLLMATNRGMEVLARAGLDAVALKRVADQAFAGLPLTARARPQRTPRPVASDASWAPLARAQHAGADVTGVDLTEEYVDVARRLTDRVGLADRARFQQGDVSALPFPRASFDRAWMLHVGMNIEDKARLFTEVSRVLTDNGLFIVYDVMLLGDPALVSYPLPWASESGHSFLARPEDYRSLLRKAGFDIVAEHDHRSQAAQSLREAGTPISVAMGTDASIKLAKALQNIEEGLLAPTEMICRLR